MDIPKWPKMLRSHRDLPVPDCVRIHLFPGCSGARWFVGLIWTIPGRGVDSGDDYADCGLPLTEAHVHLLPQRSNRAPSSLYRYRATVLVNDTVCCKIYNGHKTISNISKFQRPDRRYWMRPLTLSKTRNTPGAFCRGTQTHQGCRSRTFQCL